MNHNALDMISFTALYGAELFELPDEGSEDVSKEILESGLQTLRLGFGADADDKLKLAIRNAVAIGYLSGMVKAEQGAKAPPAELVVLGMRTAAAGVDFSDIANAWVTW